MRSANMQKLTDQMKARYPGMVIYGIGDEAHQSSASGHNEDDTPGSLAEDQDADTKPEHRALDLMLGPAFTYQDAANHVNAMVTVPANRARLLYVIFDHHIWRRAGGWVKEWYSGSDPHTNHVHDSGEADDDENTAAWVLDPPAAPTQQEDHEMALPLVFHNTTAGETTYAYVFGPGEVVFSKATDGDNDAGEYELASATVVLTGQKNTAGQNGSQGLSGPAWQALLSSYEVSPPA